jgi:hypothetical protein
MNSEKVCLVVRWNLLNKPEKIAILPFSLHGISSRSREMRFCSRNFILRWVWQHFSLENWSRRTGLSYFSAMKSVPKGSNGKKVPLRFQFLKKISFLSTSSNSCIWDLLDILRISKYGVSFSKPQGQKVKVRNFAKQSLFLLISAILFKFLKILGQHWKHVNPHSKMRWQHLKNKIEDI